MTISRRLRFEILRRDNHTCRYCGGAAPDVKLTVDHVTPIALGGKDQPENLVTACQPCNAGKSSASPDQAMVADVEQRVVLWERAIQLANERRRSRAFQLDALLDDFGNAWNAWTYGPEGSRSSVPRSADWRSVLRVWLEGGLTIGELMEHIPTAMQRERGARGRLMPEDRWSYFCGIGWNLLRELEREARQIVNEQQRAVEVHEADDRLPDAPVSLGAILATAMGVSASDDDLDALRVLVGIS